MKIAIDCARGMMAEESLGEQRHRCRLTITQQRSAEIMRQQHISEIISDGSLFISGAPTLGAFYRRKQLPKSSESAPSRSVFSDSSRASRRNVLSRVFGTLVCTFLACNLVFAGQASDLPVKKYLPLSLALEAAQAALSECVRQGLNVAVSVVDRSGATRSTIVSDGAGPIATDTSRRKAFTSAVLGIPTGEFGKMLATFPVGTIPVLDPAVLALAGGIPIKVGNEVIAGIGVGGADNPEKDQMCAQAGINKIKDYLN